MPKALAVTAIVALLVPLSAFAQERGGNSEGTPPRPYVVPPSRPMLGPPRGPGGGQFSYRGVPFRHAHVVPFVYPPGWTHRRWVVGAILPPVILVPDYYYTDWAALGLEPPPTGYQWVRYGSDLLLVDLSTSEVVDMAYDALY